MPTLHIETLRLLKSRHENRRRESNVEYRVKKTKSLNDICSKNTHVTLPPPLPPPRDRTQLLHLKKKKE